MRTKPILLLAIASFISYSSYSQIQYSTDLDGAAANDGFGTSVTISGDAQRVAIGGPANSALFIAAGHVRVFERSGANWVQKGFDMHGELDQDNMGGSIAMDYTGKHIVIGASNNDGGGINSGHVRVYEWTGSTWARIGLDIDGANAMDRFGYSVAISADGRSFVAGAFLNDLGGTNSGTAYVYERVGNYWQLKGNPIPGLQNGDHSAYAISMSSDGNRIAIGAPKADPAGLQSGQTRVFDWNGSAWIQAGQTINGSNANERAGEALSLSGDGNTLAVSSFYDSTGIGRGKVNVYTWNAGVWQLKGSPLLGESTGDRSGVSVSMNYNGNRVAIGAHNNSGSGSLAGHARIYDWIGTAWVKIGADIDGENPFDRSGHSIGLDSTGSNLIVGAPFNDGGGSNSGSARTYTLNPLLNVFLPKNSLKESNVYPNPFIDRLNISFKQAESGQISLRNASAQTVFAKSFHNEVKLKIQGDFKPGVYLLEIRYENGQIESQKLIVAPE